MTETLESVLRLQDKVKKSDIYTKYLHKKDLII